MLVGRSNPPLLGIGVREFECIGESPPQDQPHVYINKGETGTILCPYQISRMPRSFLNLR
jgi:uncharacterized Zn-finger protein